jgi:hypothetical protein
MSNPIAAAGIDAKTYILTTGTRATWGTVSATTGAHEGAAPASLTEIDVIRNVDFSVTDSDGDGSMRRSKFKLYIPTQMDAPVSMDVLYVPTDPQFILLRNAKFTRKVISLAILDGDKATTGTQGLWGDFYVSEFSPPQPIDKEIVCKITVKLTPSTVAPEWVQVTGGG